MKKGYKVAFTLLVVVVLVWFLSKFNFMDLYLLITYIDIRWFLLAVLATFMTFIVWNIRWMYISHPYIKGGFWIFLRIILVSAFFSTLAIDPGVSGEPIRAHFVSKVSKRPRAKVFAYVLGDAFFRLSALAVFTLFSILFLLVYIKISSTLRLILYILLGIVLIVSTTLIYLILKKNHYNVGSFFKRLHFLSFIKKRFKTPELFEEFLNIKVKTFVKTFREVVKKKNNILVGVPLSLVFWSLNYLAAYFLFLSFGIEVNFLSIIIVFTLGNLIGSFSPVPGGIGVTEGLMTFLYSAMGVNIILALVVSLLQRAIYYFFSLVIGGLCLINLRKITHEK